MVIPFDSTSFELRYSPCQMTSTTTTITNQPSGIIMASIDDNESSSLQEMLSNEASILGSSVPELYSAKMRRFASPNLIWREKVTQWCYDVVDHLNESRDIVYVAMNLLDRYCTRRRTAVKRRQEPTSNIVPVAATTSTSRTNRQQEDDDDMDKPEYDVDMDEREYELAAMTAVFLAVRVSGSGNLEVPDLIRMSRGGIELRDVIATGKAMIELLSEQQCLCTPIQFLRAFLDLLLPAAASATSVPNDNAPTRSKAVLLDVASFLVEISVCDAFFIGIAPSKLAMAAVIHASSAASHASSFTDGERHSFYTLLAEATGVPCNHADIVVLRQRLHSLYCQSDESNRLSPHVVPDDDDEENAGEVATLATTNQASSPSDSTCNKQVSRADIPTVAESGRASITHRGKRAVSPERTTIPSDSSTTRCPSSKRYKHCV